MSELTDAIDREAGLREAAADVWKQGADKLITPKLLVLLYPLLTKPIPQPFIQTVGRVQGKPYESTGIRSVQAQVDRMNNVLGPHNWRDSARWLREGTVCQVRVEIGQPGGEALVTRSSRGGVERGTGAGNLFKGSYTNAAKLAFARVGPGHEVYLGAADFDPDVNEDAVSAQADGGDGKIGPSGAEWLKQAILAAGIDTSSGEFQAKLVSAGAKDIDHLADLTSEQGHAVYQWVKAEVTDG